MNETTRTDGAGNILSKVYSDPHDMYAPSYIQDGNGYAANPGATSGKGTWHTTWDSYGNLQTVTTPRATTTTNTWNYSNFALGELQQTETAGKQASTCAYYEPSGLPQTITVPQPGTVDGTTGVTYSYTYDSLGNVLTAKTPGNNATIVGGVDQGITTTYNYTTDGTYTQSDAIGQPLTSTNNLGKIWHYRYDARGNTLPTVDSLGNETGQNYTLADQPLQTTFPKTGQSGTGNLYL